MTQTKALARCTATKGSIGRETVCNRPAIVWYSERRPDLRTEGVTHSCCAKHAPKDTDGTRTARDIRRYGALEATLRRNARSA